MYQVAHNTLHMISTRFFACDLHAVVPWLLERTCWRQFMAQQGDCKKSTTALLNTTLIIFIIIITIIFALFISSHLNSV